MATYNLISLQQLLLTSTMLGLGLLPKNGFTQDRKLLYAARDMDAIRATSAPVIDGYLDETAWQDAPVAEGFLTTEPDPGKVPYQPSRIKVLYDDNALYIGAHLVDPSPDSIQVTLSERDDTGNADWFGVLLCPYQDGQNGFAMIVTAAGVQVDEKWTGNSSDRNFDAVWNSEVRVGEDGWYAEIEIPYGAIRFPAEAEQDWGINFARNIRRKREESWWSPVDVAEQGLLQQVGNLVGLENIRAPFRLSLTPYVSGIMEVRTDPGSNTTTTFWDANGGMDLKYGINDAFTLDMTLIPDFNQVRFDNQVLNLSPFEVRFDENRAFFTEGTELFNKLGLFYSRRVGGMPLGFGAAFDDLGENEEMLSNPTEARLLNATKISGRTDGGLGIGVFNGITARTEATIRKSDGDTRTFETAPLTNYSVFVLDQNLPRPNSFINFTNTNVWRSGSQPEANVTGLSFRFRDRENRYEIGTNGALTQKYTNDFQQPNLGHTAGAFVSKVSGQFVFDAGYYEESDTYNPNDLGFLFNNNERTVYANANYNRYEPKGRFNQLYHYAGMVYTRLYAPNEFANLGFFADATQIWKSFFASGVFVNLEPIPTYDWFEPREPGRALLYPVNATLGSWISSDYRKALAIDANINGRLFDDVDPRYTLSYSVSPRWRVNDKVLLIASFERYQERGDLGWVNSLDNDDIIMGRRDVVTSVTGFNANYIFTNRMFLTFRMRHYWSNANYLSYHRLADDGSLAYTDYDGLEENGTSTHNVNFNAFTIDAQFTWRYAPGSDLIIVWKDGIFSRDNDPARNYFNNLERTFMAEQTNNLSVRAIWYLDYVLYRRWRNRRLERADQADDARFISPHSGRRAMQGSAAMGPATQTSAARPWYTPAASTPWSMTGVPR